MTEKEALPTQSGTTMAYEVQARELGEKWKQLSTREGPVGVPAGGFGKGAITDLGLLTYEQAMGLAWCFKADAIAKMRYDIEVRVLPYDFRYSMKAYALEAKAIAIGEPHDPKVRNDSSVATNT